jgi:flagellar biogenesis protein FliO
MSSVFGVELPTPVNFIIAFVFVLLLIGAAAWLVRRFGAAQIDAATRGRQPRLAVVDSAAVDGRRKLVIIRRDNVEHLLMIGGPTDVVIETNLVRGTAAATRDAPAARNGGAETLPRAAMPADSTPWPLQPEPVPLQQSVRNARAAADDIWETPAEPAAATAAATPVPDVRPVRPADTLAGLADDIARPAAEITTTRGGAAQNGQGGQAGQGGQVQQLRPTPPTLPTAATVAPPNQAADQSLAEMAQRLEAALRRPMAQKLVAAETPRITATLDVKAATPKGPAPAKTQSGNLEQEMASLLSKPGKT